ncbi:NosD domain-containing protein [Methanospirillum hungatei]|uniref:NosD domain-containing protein n=1 Tax=Methanospirillum hungatei TaxID=2203 RepID=UPI0026EA734D|nr:NosD domain-containing protein [Methanospirillum hungatei]MCA1916942.1 right-handed parallel beta-helix repeat-containing protein [Methanospirillum hungatei]
MHRSPVCIPLLFLILLATFPVMAETWTVCPSGCRFSSIQEAITAASDGDTIVVQSGTYDEAVRIDRSITIVGMDTGGGLPVVGRESQPVAVTISAPDVVLANISVEKADERALDLLADRIKVENATFLHQPDDPSMPVITGSGLSSIEISRCRIHSSGRFGIVLENSSEISIAENAVTLDPNPVYCGIGIVCSFENTGTVSSGVRVLGNVLENGGIEISCGNSDPSVPTRLYSVSILENTVLHPSGYGIMVFGSVDDLDKTTGDIFHLFDVDVSGNSVEGSHNPVADIRLEGLKGGSITRNTVRDSSGVKAGILLDKLDFVCIADNTVRDCSFNPDEWGTGFDLYTITNSTLSRNTLSGVSPCTFDYAPGTKFLPNLTFDQTNTADGRPVLYFEGQQGITIDSQDPAMVVLMSCRDVLVKDCSIRDGGLGLGVYNSSGTTISGCLFEDQNRGIMLINSTDSVISDNGFVGPFLGLGIGNNRNATIIANDFSGYADTGITVHCSSADDVLITGNTFFGQNQDTGQGIAVVDAYAKGVTISGNMIENNARGILLLFAEDAYTLSNTLRENSIGMNMNGARDCLMESNTISNSRDDAFGFLLSSGYRPGLGPTFNNTFSNNYIESAIPLLVEYLDDDDPEARSAVGISGEDCRGSVIGSCAMTARKAVSGPSWANDRELVWQVDEEDLINTWNITKTSGQNILGGPYIGGNYWATPNGTGWSQITADRGDGFCRAPYVYNANNTDHLPLHTRTKPPFFADFTVDPISGTAPLTIRFNDASDGDALKRLYRFGDGVFSPDKDPVHTYQRPGIYTVSLTIWGLEDRNITSQTTVREGYITVMDPIKSMGEGVYTFGQGSRASERNTTSASPSPEGYPFPVKDRAW